MHRMKIKPARDGLKVPDPMTGLPIPSDGANVVDSHYWQRRLAAGDVVRFRGTRKGAAKSGSKTNHQETEG